MDYNTPTDLRDFGKRLQWLRDKKRISRRTLADFVGVSRNSIMRYERGDRFPDIAVAARLAAYFCVKMDWLIGEEKY